MTVRLSVDEYRALQARKPTKYRNIRRAAEPLDPGSEYTSPLWGTRVYDSKAEARYAAQLDQLVQLGTIRAWVPQPSFPLRGTTRRIRVDFMVIDNEGRVSLRDVKGAPPTDAFKIKAQLMESSSGLKIEIVR